MRLRYVLWAVGLALLVAGCGSTATVDTSDVSDVAISKSEVTRAVASLNPTEGNQVYGTVSFESQGDSVTIRAEIEGLTPGLHGFHIHEVGDCSDPAGKSAGGHFNPANVDHGGHGVPVRHVGDLGNLEADENGRATLELTDSKAAFDGPNSILGRSVIVHEKEDDLVSQPTGAAGARVACGIIEAQ